MKYIQENRSCTECLLVKSITEFPKSGGGGRNGLDLNGNPYRRHQCKPCHWSLKKKLPSGRIGKAKKLKEYKSKCKCAVCGYSKETRGKKFSTAVLNFHHHNSDKLENVGNMIKRYGWNTILKEIEKCIVICFNCHMELHNNKVHDLQT
ncbi:MAG: hypothetical protein ACPHEO_04100 [Flavobacteriaceae bacterium]